MKFIIWLVKPVHIMNHYITQSILHQKHATVIMTATPIFDKPIEIALTMNLFLPKRGKLNNQIPTGQGFVDMFIDTKYTTKGISYKVKNMDLFKNYIRGYVSYYRGAPPYVFPRSELFFVRTKMSEKQVKLYRDVITESTKNLNNNDYINTDISNSFFIGTRTISNFVFPNGKTGKLGYDSLKENDFTVAKMKEYSPKFLKILRKIKKCDGTVFVYSNFKEYGGIKTFVRLLKHHKFKNYDKNGAGTKRFAVWSGDQSPMLKEEIKAIFNNKNNEDGSQIKIICASPSAKEGVSFLRVQEVHIVEPYWNFSRLEQIMGRAIRFCSHKDVPYEKQLVKVYIYLAVHSKIGKSIDERIMKMAIQKKLINQQFEKALKEVAIDCELFKNANVYPGEKNIVCEV